MYVSTLDGKISALDVNNGEVKWTKDFNNGPLLSSSIHNIDVRNFHKLFFNIRHYSANSCWLLLKIVNFNFFFFKTKLALIFQDHICIYILIFSLTIMDNGHVSSHL